MAAGMEISLPQPLSADDSLPPPMACCVCGIICDPNQSRMCIHCVRANIDITEGINRHVLLPHCKQCLKYLKPPWVTCEPESAPLLALCLKKVRGLNRVKLVEASFLWTEAHSKRLKVKATVQKEVLNGCVIQQTFTIEYIVQSTMCDDCKRTYTPHTWNAIVQVRQKAEHKRTFLYLEQLLLKHDAHERATHIDEKDDGLDFHFMSRNEAVRFVDFISSRFPTRRHDSKKLISHDDKSNSYYNKYTLLAELGPVCKDDLVSLPHNLCTAKGGISPIMLCYRVGSLIQLLDPFTLRGVDIPSDKYWKNPFKPILTRRNLADFVVLNVEDVDPPNSAARAAAAGTGTSVGSRRPSNGTAMLDETASMVSAVASLASTRQSAANRAVCPRVADRRFRLVDVEIARLSDLGSNDRRVIVRSHLGNVLKPGDYCQGYDLNAINLSGADDMLSTLGSGGAKYDVVLVRRSLPSAASIRRRPWILQWLPKGTNRRPVRGGDEVDGDGAESVTSLRRKQRTDAAMTETSANPKPRQQGKREGGGGGGGGGAKNKDTTMKSLDDGVAEVAVVHKEGLGEKGPPKRGRKAKIRRGGAAVKMRTPGAVGGLVSEKDIEDFVRELEEDPDLRKDVNLWTDPTYNRFVKKGDTNKADEDEHEAEHYDVIPLEEMLDGLTLEDDGWEDEDADDANNDTIVTDGTEKQS